MYYKISLHTVNIEVVQKLKGYHSAYLIEE